MTISKRTANNLNYYKSIHLLLSWLLLTSTAPFIFFRWPGHPYKILTFFLLGLVVAFLLIKHNKLLFDKNFIFLITLQLFYYFIISFYHNDFTNLNLSIQLVTLLFIILYIKTYIDFNLFAKSLINISLIMGIFGTIAFFLHAIIGLNPIFTVQYGNDISYFLGITTTNVYINNFGVRIIRYSGFFDEPGTFALFSLFAILINKLYFQNKNKEILLILVTCFTFSIAFYISIIIYFLLFYFKIKHLKFIILLLILISLIFYYFKDQNDTIAKVYEITVNRLSVTNNGISNTNRSDLLTKDLNLFLNNPFFGVGSLNKDLGGANFFAIFARYGIVGSLFYYIHLLYLFYVSIKSKKQIQINIKCFIVLLMTLFYRPELSSVLTLLSIYTMSNYITIQSKNFIN